MPVESRSAPSNGIWHGRMARTTDRSNEDEDGCAGERTTTVLLMACGSEETYRRPYRVRCV